MHDGESHMNKGLRRHALFELSQEADTFVSGSLQTLVNAASAYPSRQDLPVKTVKLPSAPLPGLSRMRAMLDRYSAQY